MNNLFNIGDTVECKLTGHRYRIVKVSVREGEVDLGYGLYSIEDAAGLIWPVSYGTAHNGLNYINNGRSDQLAFNLKAVADTGLGELVRFMFEQEPAEAGSPPDDSCKCGTTTLMLSGCKCGYLKRFNAKKKEKMS